MTIEPNPIFDKIVSRLRNNNIIFALFTIFIAFLAYKLTLVLVILFIAFVLTVVLLPLVEALMKRGFPRGLAVFSVSLGLTVLVFGIGYLLIPPLAKQFQNLFHDLPGIINQIPFLQDLKLGASFSNLVQTIVTKFSSTIFSFTQTLLSLVVAVISIIVINVYLLADYPKTRTFLLRGFGSYKNVAARALENMEHRIGGWVRGQLLLMLAIGILFLIAYYFIDLPSALPLALLAGIFEIIPVVGPLIAIIPALLIAFTVSFQTVIVVLVVFLVIQQLENHILAPKIMSRTAELHPLAVILALLVGGQLAGFLGLLLAVPLLLLILSIFSGLKGASETKETTPSKPTRSVTASFKKLLRRFPAIFK